MYLFNGISTSNGLSNAKILLICKHLIIIITIFSTFHCNHFFESHIFFYLSIIIICLHTSIPIQY